MNRRYHVHYLSEKRWREHYDFDGSVSRYDAIIKEDITPIIESGEFWWNDLTPFYLDYFRALQPKAFQSSRYLNLEKIKDLISSTQLDVNLKDTGGNNFIDYLFHKAFGSRHNNDAVDDKILLFNRDVEPLVDLLSNPNSKNVAGENWFWHINNINYTGMNPSEKLMPLIEKYNINVFERTPHDDDLFENALRTQDNGLVEFYLKLGANIENRPRILNNFIFHYVDNRSHSDIRQVFIDSLKLYDPFSKLFFPKNNHKSESIMETWLSFLPDSHSTERYLSNMSLTMKQLSRSEVLTPPTSYKAIASFLRDFTLKIPQLNLSLKERTKALELIAETSIWLEKTKIEKAIALSSAVSKESGALALTLTEKKAGTGPASISTLPTKRQLKI